MTAAVIIGVVALISLSATSVAIAVLVSKALARAFRALDKMHARSGQQIDSLLDRLAAIRWEDLAALRSVDEPDSGAFITPEEQADEVEQIFPPPKWGALTALRDKMTKEEEDLLAEDFTDGEVVR